MVEAVAIEANGSVLVGEYDGYGRIGDHEIDAYGEGPVAYHKECWDHAGRPTNDLTPSEHAGDQGFFFNDGDHDMAPPSCEDPETYITEKRIERTTRRQAAELCQVNNWFEEAWYALCKYPEDEPTWLEDEHKRAVRRSEYGDI